MDAETDPGLAASDIGEDGLVSRTVEAFRDVGSFWKLSSLHPPARPRLHVNGEMAGLHQ